MALTFLATSLLAGITVARSGQHVNKRIPENRQQKAAAQAAQRIAPRQSPPSYGGSGSNNGPIIPQNSNTTKYKVDGSVGSIPFVDFDIGESYAGLLPISDEDDASELYFWFYPSHNPEADDEILIWLNGGPGCSSLEGILQVCGLGRTCQAVLQPEEQRSQYLRSHQPPLEGELGWYTTVAQPDILFLPLPPRISRHVHPNDFGVGERSLHVAVWHTPACREPIHMGQPHQCSLGRTTSRDRVQQEARHSSSHERGRSRGSISRFLEEFHRYLQPSQPQGLHHG